MPKRILVYATQQMETGGIESHLLEFCKHMSSKVEIDLLILYSEASDEVIQTLNSYCCHVALGQSQNKKKSIVWLFLNALKLFKYKYSAIYTNGQGKSIWLVSKLFRYSKWVHHHHTSGDKEDQMAWPMDYVKSLKKADDIIACSTKNANEMSLALNRKVKTIPVFSRNIKPISDRSSALNSTIQLGYFGRLIPEKGIEVICKLSEEFKNSNVEFKIWGEGAGYTTEFFKKYENLTYEGKFFSQDQLTKVISNLDGFLLITSHAEGLPVSLLECMSAGLPWIATDRGGIRDIALDPYSTRLIARDSNFLQIANEVRKFVEDLADGKISKANQIQLYKTKFSSKILIKKWVEILEC